MGGNNGRCQSSYLKRLAQNLALAQGMIPTSSSAASSAANQPSLQRPLRHYCLALRASDRRITPAHWVISPEHAMDLDSPGPSLRAHRA
jgi:hypothetical protein